jgi:hypothetical protein
VLNTGASSGDPDSSQFVPGLSRKWTAAMLAELEPSRQRALARKRKLGPNCVVGLGDFWLGEFRVRFPDYRGSKKQLLKQYRRLKGSEEQGGETVEISNETYEEVKAILESRQVMLPPFVSNKVIMRAQQWVEQATLQQATLQQATLQQATLQQATPQHQRLSADIPAHVSAMGDKTEAGLSDERTSGSDSEAVAGNTVAYAVERAGATGEEAVEGADAVLMSRSMVQAPHVSIIPAPAMPPPQPPPDTNYPPSAVIVKLSEIGEWISTSTGIFFPSCDYFIRT